MKITITDSRSEERHVQRKRTLSDVGAVEWTSHSGREGERRSDSDSRQVSVWFEEDDYATLGIPRLDRGRTRGKHDGQFFVAKVGLTFRRSYDFEDAAYASNGVGTETERGWGGPTINVSGDNRRADGTVGANSNSTHYPVAHEVDDETRPYTFANWKAQLRYASELEAAKDIHALDDLRAAVANYDDGGKSYRRHSLASELQKIEQGEVGKAFFTKREVDPLPDYLGALVTRVHPATGELPFVEPEEHRYGTFPDVRTAATV